MWNGGKVRGTTLETYLSLFGTIPEFSQKLATMRKYEISCTIIIQALSQIKSLYEKEWEVLIGNCDSLLFLGGSDQTTLKYISERLGKETIRSQNNSRSYGKQGSYSLSFNKTGRELLTADEIAVMDNNNCILFIRGQYPFFTTKYNYPRHPNYHLTGDANDNNQFNPKSITTGQLIRKKNENAEKAKMVDQQAAKADFHQAERERKLNARKVQKTGIDGTSLHEPLPTREFVETVCKTSTPCEMAKSMMISNQNFELDAKQYESLRQYCSEEELAQTFLHQNIEEQTKTTQRVQHKPELAYSLADKPVSEDKVKPILAGTPSHEEAMPDVFYIPDNEDMLYLDTYQEISFDDVPWEENTEADYHMQQFQSEYETHKNSAAYQQCPDIEEDASELGELMQKAIESVTPSDGEGM